MEDKNKRIAEQLKKLNEIKGPVDKNLINYVKETTTKQKLIMESLKDGEKTIKEISQKTNINSSEVLKLVAGLTKYGKIEHLPAKTGYMKYKLVEKK